MLSQAAVSVAPTLGGTLMAGQGRHTALHLTLSDADRTQLRCWSRSRRVDAGLARRLRDAVAGDVLFDRASRGRYSTDASIYQVARAMVLPLTVLFSRVYLGQKISKAIFSATKS